MGRKLSEIFELHREAICERWFKLIIETYPSQTSQFMKKERDRFQNPVGYTLSREIKVLYDQVVSSMDREVVVKSLESILKIRAVQDFTPSRALVFILFLKRAFREELRAEFSDYGNSEEVKELEGRIDELLLIAFDIYMRVRERIYEVRAKEARNMTFKLLERMNKVNGL